MKWIDDAVDCHHCTPEFAEEVRNLLGECERALLRLSNWFAAHAADAPEWTGKEQVKCYFSIDELRQAQTTLAKLRAAQEKDR